MALAAPTGKAAARLKQSIDASLVQLQDALGDRIDLNALTQRVGAARTLHALLGARPDTKAVRLVRIVERRRQWVVGILQATPHHAYVVPRDGAAVDAATLDRFLVHGDRLAAYKRPRRYHFVAALPKTTSGKIQKHLLQAAAQAA